MKLLKRRGREQLKVAATARSRSSRRPASDRDQEEPRTSRRSSGLAVIALAVAGYILHNQRLRFPFVQAKPFQLKAEFSTAQAVTPGQGQTVRVSGVRIGDIGGVDLKDGHAIVIRWTSTRVQGPGPHRRDRAAAAQDRAEGHVHRPAARAATSAPVAKARLHDPDLEHAARTSTRTRSSRLLDADTREYLQLLVNGAGAGPARAAAATCATSSARFEPTHRDLARVNGAVAARRTQPAPPDQPAQRAQRRAGPARATTSPSSSTPPRPSSARSPRSRPTSPRAVARAAEHAAQTTDDAQPGRDVRRRARPDGREAAPGGRARSTPPTRRCTRSPRRRRRCCATRSARSCATSRPLVRDLKPASTNLATATPDLTRVVHGRSTTSSTCSATTRTASEGPDNADREEGYLFWLAWLNHYGAALFSTSDANGAVPPGHGRRRRARR